MMSVLSELACFWRDERAAAAAEMALVTPLLVILLFGPMEAGRYFWSSHIAANAARDGARFASRQPLVEFPTTSGCTPSTVLVSSVREVTRTGQVSNGSPRLPNWQASDISVSGRCTVRGPVVTVAVDAPYAALFLGLGFDATALRVRSQSEVTVSGL
jgi:hypothetical protein